MPAPVLVSPNDLHVCALTLSGEADDQGREGKIWVAWVLRNRMEWKPSAWWGNQLGRCCSYPRQFSCWNPDTKDVPNEDLKRINAIKATDPCYIESLDVATQVMSGKIEDPTGGSTTYKVRGTSATWDGAVSDFVPRIMGDHDFWRLSPLGPCLPFTDGDSDG